MREDALNIRYFLWSEGIPKDIWVERLGRWLETRDSSRVRELLRKGGLSGAEADKLSAVLHVSTEDLMYGRAYESVDVLEYNLEHLFGSLGHGGKKQIADEMKVDQTTISRWLSGQYPPKPANQLALAKVLGIPPDKPLASYPHFLSEEPASDQARRQWLHEQIDAADTDELRSLFPALRRLLER